MVFNEGFKNKLAFIIPLYKTAYLSATLQSLSEQTNKNFNVYIGDDCSPNPPDKIIEEFSQKLTIHYTRFTQNVGGINPVRNWNRCLDLVQDEEWICMLPDDDMLSSDVVEDFYQCLQNSKDQPVYAFKMGTKTINSKGEVRSIRRVSSGITGNYEYFSSVFKGNDDCTLGDVIYSKKRLLEVGKFKEFPKAWCSDHCGLIEVTSGGLMYNLPNSFLTFRMSGENISSQIIDGSIKMRARYLFGKWLRNNESVWDTPPSKELYLFFYWKSEYYFLYVWPFSFISWWYLYKLSVIMSQSWSPLPPVKALFKRLFQKKKT